MPERLTTTVSTKGQVILPKAIRRALRWEAGTRLVVENRPEGVLLRREPAFAETRPEDVFGCLAYDGPPKSLSDMQAGVLIESSGNTSFRVAEPWRSRVGMRVNWDQRPTISSCMADSTPMIVA